MGSLYGMVQTSKGGVISVETMLVRENGGKELEVVSHRLLGAFISIYFYLFSTSWRKLEFFLVKLQP